MSTSTPRKKDAEKCDHVYVRIDPINPSEMPSFHYVESCDSRQKAIEVIDYINERVPPTDEAVYHSGPKVAMPAYDMSRLKEKGNNDPVEKEMIAL